MECPLHLDGAPARAGHRPAGRPWQPGRQRAVRPDGAGRPRPTNPGGAWRAIAAQCENLIVVSNEVFSGGADYAGDTDHYLKALAQVNNALAARADAVVRRGVRHPGLLQRRESP